MATVVSFGEIMMRLNTPGFGRFMQASHLNITYGGGEANMSLSLSHLGIPAKHVTVFPDNDLGRAANVYFKKHGVEMDVQFQEGRLGIYFLETGAASRASKVVYDRYNSAFSDLDPARFDWKNILNKSEYFLFTGITPAISASAAEACLQAVTAAKAMGIEVLGDVNYRRNLWKYGKSVKEIMPALVEKCTILNCSETDAEDIFDIKPLPDESNTFISVCKQLTERFPRIHTIITSRRNSESASRNTLKGLVWNRNNYFETGDYPIDYIVDRIGSGDAFVAGFVYGRLQYNNDEKAIKFATAAAILKHTIEGDSSLATVEEIETVMNGNFSAKLLR